MSEAKIGKYTIVGEIGRGAMGIVYKALDPYIGRTVAIKTIRFDTLGQGPEREIAQKRFMREAHSAGNLSHPNIVTIYDVGEDQGISYIAMEYVDGPSLDDLMHAQQKFSLQEILNLIEQVAEGLENAHKKGVVHRDVKPANILIDSEGRPRIVDFGIARISTSTMTQTNMIMGTPYYMSPEQISGRRVDNRADIFALGGILYELLTGQKAFPGDNLTTVIYRIINEEPMPIRTLKKGLPEGLDYIVSKALAKAPEERYQTCREFIHDLRHYTQLKAPAPAPPPAPAPSLAPTLSSAPSPQEEAAAAPMPHPILREVRRREERPRREPRPEFRRKTVVIVLASMLAVTAVVIGAIILFPKGTENRRVTPGPSLAGPGPAKPGPAAVSSADLFQTGRALWGQQKLAEAQASFERVSPSAPEYFDSRLYMAAIWEAQDKLGAAASEYRRLIDLNAKDGRPYLHLGEIDERRGELASALTNYRKFVEISPNGAEAEGIRWKIKTLESRTNPPPQTNTTTTGTNAPGPSSANRTAADSKTVPDAPKPEVKTTQTKTQPPSPAGPPKPPEKKTEMSKAEREADLAQMVEVAKRSVEKRSYSQAIQQLKSVLNIDPGNKEAKYYLNVAQTKLEDETKKATVKQDVEQARAALRAENYTEAIVQSRRALALDAEQIEAKKIIDSAVVRAAPADLKALLDQYLQAVRQGELKAFYSQQCTPELYQRIRKEAEIITSTFQNFQVSGSGLEVKITDVKFDHYLSEAAFSQVMTGLSREKGTRQVLFEGKMRWALINLGGGWRISEMTATPKRKK